jgi:hypothetical protein
MRLSILTGKSRIDAQYGEVGMSFNRWGNNGRIRNADIRTDSLSELQQAAYGFEGSSEGSLPEMQVAR